MYPVPNGGGDGLLFQQVELLGGIQAEHLIRPHLAQGPPRPL